MRAPVLDFQEELIDREELPIFICNGRIDIYEICGAQILKASDVMFLTEESVTAEDDHCINIYDAPTNGEISSAKLIDGNLMHCLKCNAAVGVRITSKIVFDTSKVKEMIIYSCSRLLDKFLSIVDNERNYNSDNA